MLGFEIKQLSTKHLLLDPNNYRFQDEANFAIAEESKFHLESVQERAEKKLRDESLILLKKSIIKNGFLPVEPLVVKEYPFKESHFVVLEGNRRLAALRWISDDIEAGVDIPNHIKEQLHNIPSIVVSHSEEDPSFYEALMGVRHVSGVKQWGGYQRSKLVAVLRDERMMSPEEIGERLAMSVREVYRRYRAFKALDNMKHSEDYAEFSKPSLYPLFHEAVSQPIIRDGWLAWDEKEFVFKEEENLHAFYSLITPNDPEEYGTKDPKIRTHSDVRELKSIVSNEDSLQVLLDPTRSFFDAIAIARQQELSHRWVQKVNSAISSLEAIDYKELKNMSEENIDKLKLLQKLASEIIEDSLKIKS